ncbi:von Willebrand factor type A domain containing protein [Seminavis robusta]|uniref:von Willebrand factor type A domain containing protein n=1 Tax=Seminavis robusta TaxID=568900 RepID=A0A9N8EDB7_9STRA|nr:von Willebrand factor type A domain containing protein [Seminavis robusta]|eukprot:Sro1010_g230890.1 von Willebrand factor type A domain containing protein (552) ;mRNA; r:23202-24857
MRTDASFATATDSTTAAETGTVASMDFSFVNVNTPTLHVTTSPRHESIGLGAGLTQTQVCVNMKARELPDDDEQRAPIDLIVGLDVSGSMNNGKLELCKKTLLMLLRVLYPKDRFGLICFAENAKIEVPVQRMTEANKARCVEKVRALRTRGCTNMSAAVGLVCEEMRQIDIPNEVQTVFFLTDGHANAGISKADALVDFTKNCFTHESMTLQGTEGADDQPSGSRFRFRRPSQPKNVQEDAKPAAVMMDTDAKPRSPITLCTFGYGSDHDADLLRNMSDVVPGGSYYFVENDSNVGAAFGDALGGVLSVVAQNVVVSLTVPPEAKAKGVEIVDVHHESKVKRENGSYTVVVGDFYAEESRDVLFEVKLANSNGTNDRIHHVGVAVSYTDTLLKAPAKAHPTACLISRPLGTDMSLPNPHVEVNLTRLNATKAMAQANSLAQARNWDGARACLQRAKGEVKAAWASAPSRHREDLASLEADFVHLEGGFSSAAMYEAQGSKMVSNMRSSHVKQRAMRSSVGSSWDRGSAPRPAAYQSKKKCAMQSKFSSSS